MDVRAFEDHDSYRVGWSAEDGAYVGTVVELPSLSWVDEDRARAFGGIQRLVEEVVAEMVEAGETGGWRSRRPSSRSR